MTGNPTRARGPGGKFLPGPAAAPVATQRISVLPPRRDPIAVPSKYRHPGKRPRFVRLTDNQLENDAHLEEMEELGYHIVRDEAGKPVQRRGSVLMEIDEALADQRLEAKAAYARDLNRRQAQAMRDQMRERLTGLPDGEVIEASVKRDQPEALISDDEVKSRQINQSE